jgi:hypothetical protein
MMHPTGIGAEVQRPPATIVAFGMACDPRNPAVDHFHPSIED